MGEMDKKTENRIKEKEAEIQNMERLITQARNEIDKLYLNSVGSFDGKYVRFFNPDYGYTFMKVEKSRLTNYGSTMELEGPSIELNCNPLDQEDNEISSAVFYDLDNLQVSRKVLLGVADCTLDEISVNEFLLVYKCLKDTMDKKLF